MSDVYFNRSLGYWFVWVNGFPCCFKTKVEAVDYEKNGGVNNG